MPESEQERLARFQAWLIDLELLAQEAARVQDKVAFEAATIMRSECQSFIAETQKKIAMVRASSTHPN